MIELLADPHAWLALVTLTMMEIVLGIDNVVFIAILVSRLPIKQQARARAIGLGLAMLMRIALLLTITWLMGLKTTLFSFFGHDFNLKDLILISGGLFLLAKSTTEIHANLEAETRHVSTVSAGFWLVISQIILIDLVFSIDSIITAVGMAQHIEVMITAIVIAMLVMLWAASSICKTLEQHPSLKIMALSFLMLIGVALIADGVGMHIPKGYIYFAMAFSLAVEMVNIRLRKKSKPIHLRQTLSEDHKHVRSEN